MVGNTAVGVYACVLGWQCQWSRDMLTHSEINGSFCLSKDCRAGADIVYSLAFDSEQRKNAHTYSLSTLPILQNDKTRMQYQLDPGDIKLTINTLIILFCIPKDQLLSKHFTSMDELCLILP